jgi:hypothetical protein
MARAEHDMSSQHHGTCAICLQMVSVTLCAGHRHVNGTARPLVCDECAAPRSCCDDDPDVAQLVAAYRDRRRGADDG